MNASGGEAQQSKRNKRQKVEVEDRLSQLPDDILVQILSLLDDTKLAVQTSVLCKRWKNVWTLLSTLYLDDSFTYRSAKSAFGQLLTHVLMHRNQSIKLSHLTLRCVRGFCIPQEVIEYLSIHSHNRDIEYLTVYDFYSPEKWKQFLPCLFTWESLTTLMLNRVRIPPGATFDFVSLVTLKLIDCKLWPENSGTVYDPFRSCLRLATLQLFVTSDVNVNLEISAPQLTHLKILGCIWWNSKIIISSPNLSSFCFKHHNYMAFDISSTRSNFPFLQKVDLDIYHPVLGEKKPAWKITYDQLFKLIHAMGKGKIVTLTSRTIYFIFKAIEASECHALPFVGVETFKIEVQRRNIDRDPFPYVETWPYTIPDNVLNYLLSASPSAQVLVEDIRSGEL